MIKFFRKIRQELLADQKFSKYLLYAIGEITLVVIGILIAVSINNWNESRKDVQREIKMLSDLQNDITYNISNINEGITKALDKGVLHSQNILTAFENKTKFDSAMIEDFYFYSYTWDPDFRYAAFENLKKEGVNLISNTDLRNEIIELYEIDMNILDVSDLNRLNNFMSAVGYHILNKRLYLDRKTGKALPFDYDQMMADLEFYSFASNFLSHQQMAREKSKKFIDKAALLDEEIANEIEKLK